jgi:DNA (cytosine-5)-methyltransferase 1
MDVVDLFAGAGGFSLGLKRAGWKTVLANEYSLDPEWTYRLNLMPDDELTKDLKKVRAKFQKKPDMARREVRKRLDKRRTRLRDLLDKLDETSCADKTDQELDELFKTVFWGGDVADLAKSKFLEEWAKRRKAPVDLLVGGPPCQGFSVARHASAEDPRNHLVDHLLKVVDTLKPRAVVIENVPGMLERHSDRVEGVCKRLVGSGYVVAAELLATAAYGVPQSRKRLVIIGVRKAEFGGLADKSDLEMDTFLKNFRSLVFPNNCPLARPEGSPGEWKQDLAKAGAATIITAEGALGSLGVKTKLWNEYPDEKGLEYREEWRRKRSKTDLCNEVRTARSTYLDGKRADQDEEERDEVWNDSFQNHGRTNHGKRVKDRLKFLLKEASDAPEKRCLRSLHWNLPKGLRTKKAAQRVLVADKPPNLTVTSLPDDIVHYDKAAPRIPTVREVARLQTFPDWFEFAGVRTTGADRRAAGIYVPRYTQVANAVPPRLAFAIGVRLHWFLSQTGKNRSCDPEELPKEARFDRHTDLIGAAAGKGLERLDKCLLDALKNGPQQRSPTTPAVEPRPARLASSRPPAPPG